MTELLIQGAGVGNAVVSVHVQCGRWVYPQKGDCVGYVIWEDDLVGEKPRTLALFG